MKKNNILLALLCAVAMLTTTSLTQASSSNIYPIIENPKYVSPFKEELSNLLNDYMAIQNPSDNDRSELKKRIEESYDQQGEFTDDLTNKDLVLDKAFPIYSDRFTPEEKRFLFTILKELNLPIIVVKMSWGFGAIKIYKGNSIKNFQSLNAPGGRKNDIEKLTEVFISNHFSYLRWLDLSGNKLEQLTLPNQLLETRNQLDWRFDIIPSVTALHDNQPHIFENVDPDIIVNYVKTGRLFAPAAHIIGQEAITQNAGAIQRGFEKFSTSSKTQKWMALMPSADQVNDRFNQDSEEFLDLLKKAIQTAQPGSTEAFRLEQASISLQLLQGKERDDNDKIIPRHQISSIEKYQNYANADMPNSRQLFCLVFGIIKNKLAASHAQRPEEFVKTWIAEHFNKGLSSDAFVKAFFDNKMDADAGLMLNSAKGPLFVRKLVDFVTNGDGNPFSNKPLIKLLAKNYQAFTDEQAKEDLSSFTPLIEALFMVMRGHNINLLDPNEPNKPACAQGLYLGLLSVLGETSDNGLLTMAATQKMEVTDCAAKH